ncbi:unnamed protein product [Kuraishia capsulata CBS 1993]|uniref:Uncharacterized protein n=1 Tax=Kuraishia capsulata CBS 1993 TaxID=1382522 RepID=W6MML3_9ASCO|nr:uncharacterized protein KUCA_T00003780001 [Kuraishia capsulata CBS 1993]CDK27801.1 unnamed protein product [Kuraishia capsulata CBS 1993]
MMSIGISRTAMRPILSAFRSPFWARYASSQVEPRPSINAVGVVTKYYIPPRFSRYPSFFKHPKLFVQQFLKRAALVGLNTVHVAMITRTKKGAITKARLRFGKWKTRSLEIYVMVNQAFAKRKVDVLSKSVTRWVLDALRERQAKIPEGTLLDWKMVKFNKPPKIVNVQTLPNQDGSVLAVQITYKYMTKQKLTFTKDGKSQSKESDMIEYMTFNVDPYTDEVVLAGSLFESEWTTPVQPPNQIHEGSDMLKSMAHYGDIYRPEPQRVDDNKPKTIEQKTEQ